VADRVGDRIDVAASVEEVFAVVTDFGAYPEWNGTIEEVEILELTTGAAPSRFG
jgi:uncharacterized protein YndB with AHSA1/START domain